MLDESRIYFPKPTFPEVIDNTIRSDWNRCRHYFFRRHCQGLTHSEGKGIHVHFGACLARGLEVTRRKFCAGEPQGLAVCHGGEALIKEWAGFEFNPTKRSEEVKSLDNCLLSLSDYFKQWPLTDDRMPIHYFNGEPCIEFSGHVELPGVFHPITGKPLIYSVRFDSIIDYQNSVWGEDDKTTGSLSTNGDRWSLRGQFTGYCAVAQHYGLPLKGFLVRQIQPLIKSIKFDQQISPRPAWMIAEWYDTLIRDVEEMLEEWHRYEYEDRMSFRKALDDACYAYNRACEFMPLCSSNTPERWLDEYRHSPWNPLTRNEPGAFGAL